jgi:O-antigen/teichoic acid export membrane protein
MNNYALQNLIDSIYTNYPNVCDPWEIVAIVEALGYTDKTIAAEFGCPDALVLGQFIYAQRDRFSFVEIAAQPVKKSPELLDELRIFITQFSHSFVYTIPFIIILILNYLPIQTKRDLLPPELNSLFGFVTMASLITSSGFVQTISRRGLFYMGLKDPVQANRICTPILSIGIFTTVLLSSIGMVFSFYQGIADDKYIIVAGIYYVILSTIWMLFAIVGLQYRFAAPTILIGITCCFFVFRVFIKLSALEAQVAMIAIAFISLSILSISNHIKNRSIEPKFGKQVPLPHLSVLVYLLIPYFLYGIVYFGFIFADRLVSNIATAGPYQLIPGNSLDYQDSMDLALLNLLSIVPLVEYCSYKLIMYWYDRAKYMTLAEADSLAWQLQKRYWLLLGRIFLYFGLLMSITLILLSLLDRSQNDNILTIFACFGYLFFAIGLFNTVILLSLDRLRDVLGILATATIVDFIIGYLCSSLFGVYFAAIGLLIGAILFAVNSSKKTLSAIEQAEYCYFYSGY